MKKNRTKLAMALLMALLCLLALLSIFQFSSGRSHKTPVHLLDMSFLERREKSPAGETRIPEIAERTEGKSFLLDVPFIDQRESWPTGCESVSAVMVLQYFGAEITVDEFIDGYLPLGDAPWENEEGILVGCDPRLAFSGDPRTEGGWGCYAPVICSSLERLLEERPGLRFVVEAPEGLSLEKLCETYVGAGTPVLVWATVGMEPLQSDVTVILEETGEEFTWLYPMHCLLLVGWDETGYYFNDPMAGKQAYYAKTDAERAYEGMGSQAVVLAPEE